VKRVKSARTPLAIGALPDVHCNQNVINTLLASVPGNFPIDWFVHEVKGKKPLEADLAVAGGPSSTTQSRRSSSSHRLQQLSEGVPRRV